MTAFILLAVFRINERLLFPIYVTGDSKKFLTGTILFMGFLAILHMLGDKFFVEPFKEIHPHRPIPVIFLIIRSSMMVIVAELISMTMLLNKELSRKTLKEKELREEKLSTELDLLKAQINPHFIFNALNNIYSLTYTHSEKAPESVLKLSEMLRYVLYECNKPRVPLSAEVDYINNFIAFQQMKSEHPQKISFSCDKRTENYEMPPMLFISFIENSFKYSKIEEYEEAFVDINLKLADNELIFSIENSVPFQDMARPGKGMGIENVKQRLKLLYPAKHDLNVMNMGDKYFVELKINLT
ncbi:histidine kinase [Marinilabiliaceae bacterium JC017]|nr:histidine kinase [Marinilabiliaceae bacterium JC017]